MAARTVRGLVPRCGSAAYGPANGRLERNGTVDRRSCSWADTWIENNENGIRGVIHTIGTTWTQPAESPSEHPSMAALLRAFGDKTCMAARLEQTHAIVACQ